MGVSLYGGISVSGWWSHDFDGNIHFQINLIQTSNPHHFIWRFCILIGLEAEKILTTSNQSPQCHDFCFNQVFLSVLMNSRLFW